MTAICDMHRNLTQMCLHIGRILNFSFIVTDWHLSVYSAEFMFIQQCWTAGPCFYGVTYWIKKK